MVLHRRRQLDTSYGQRRLVPADRRRGGGIPRKDVAAGRDRELLFRGSGEPQERRLVFHRRPAVAAGHRQRPVVTAGLPPGGRTERPDLPLRRWQLYVPHYEAHHDVWSSADGSEWRRETAAAPWSPRLWFSSVVYRNRMWVLGGWSDNPSRNWGDSWYSADGRNWRELKTEHIWKARHEHSALVFHDKICGSPAGMLDRSAAKSGRCTCQPDWVGAD